MLAETYDCMKYGDVVDGYDRGSTVKVGFGHGIGDGMGGDDTYGCGGGEGDGAGYEDSCGFEGGSGSDNDDEAGPQD